MKLLSRKGGTRGPESVLDSDGHVIGLDISATAVRAAVLSPAPSGEQTMGLQALGEAELPPGTVVDGVVTDPGALTKALVALWKRADLDCRHVIIGVANPQVVVRAMTMPRLPREQQAKALPFLAREIIALPLDQALLDFQQLGPAEGDADAVSGLLIAAPRGPVLVAVKAVESAGLRIVRVDLASFAVLRSAAVSGVPTEAVIDIGAQLTTIVIHHRGVPRVVRTVGRGGDHLTERLVERTGSSTTQAEILKRQVGLVESDSEVSIILRNSLRPLLGDIRGSLQYYGAANDTAPIEGVSLTGGGSELPGLLEMVSEDLGLPCAVAAPLQHVRDLRRSTTSDDERRFGAASAVSVGLAMGAAA